MLRSVRGLMLASIGAVLVVSVFTMGAVRWTVTHRNSTEIQILKSRLDAYEEIREKQYQGVMDSLNALEKTIYTPPPPPPSDRKPSSIEQWQINRFSDIEKRLKAIEQRLYRVEP